MSTLEKRFLVSQNLKARAAGAGSGPGHLPRVQHRNHQSGSPKQTLPPGRLQPPQTPAQETPTERIPPESRNPSGRGRWVLAAAPAGDPPEDEKVCGRRLPLPPHPQSPAQHPQAPRGPRSHFPEEALSHGCRGVVFKRQILPASKKSKNTKGSWFICLSTKQSRY